MAPNPIKAPEHGPASTSTLASGSKTIHDSLTLRGGDLERLLGEKPLSESTGDFLRGVEENCRRVLAKERVDLDVIKFTQRELTVFLEGKTDLTYSDLVHGVCERLRTLEEALQKTLERQRKGIWTKAVESLVEDYDGPPEKTNESDSHSGGEHVDGEHAGNKGIDEEHINDNQAEDNQVDDNNGDNVEFDFVERRRVYEALSKVVEARCQRLLQTEGADSNAILNQVSSRAKTVKSFKGKAEKAFESLSKEVVFNPKRPVTERLKEREARQHLVKGIRDLAGVRILVYFPDDVPAVVDRIDKDLGLFIQNGTISFTKSRTDNRQQDKKAIKEASDRGDGRHLNMLNISDGAFVSERTDVQGVADRWKHSGYRAVHLTVCLADLLQVDVRAQWQKARRSPAQNATEQTTAFHDDPEGKYLEKLRAVGSQFTEVKPDDILDQPVEIQITSVVMHAWSQIEHDIIYKNPFGIPVNATMTRMLDAINGQSITSEVLLDELQRKTKQIKDKMDTGIESAEDLRKFLEITHLQESKIFRTQIHTIWAEVLFEVAKKLKVAPNNVLTVRKLDRYIPGTNNHETLCTAFPGLKPDLALTILRNIGIAAKGKLEQSVVGRGCPCVQAPLQEHPLDTGHSNVCYKLTLLRLCNAISLMLTMDAVFVWESLVARTSPWGHESNVERFTDRFREINTEVAKILKGQEPDLESKEALTTFAEQFFAHRWWPAHDAAVALAQAGFFLVKADHYGVQPMMRDWRGVTNQDVVDLTKRVEPTLFASASFCSRPWTRNVEVEANIRDSPFMPRGGRCEIAFAGRADLKQCLDNGPYQWPHLHPERTYI
ncbi:hypothetical protein PRZ48_002257 [Zasmidium cellare]|uniref:RelA/SpoT domain-containing protein n=1 Tax=Zasmidium cellare TaxID=395010 RepID=A0ABR0F4Y0_ZASCE|nr:hypothetical protein PRZ48_002257 [Zasmidium cellare]